MAQSELVADTVSVPDTSNGKELSIPMDGSAVSDLPLTLSKTVRLWPYEQHVALCYASRGVGHMPSIFSALREIKTCGVEFTLCPSFYRGIPDAQNHVTEQALSSSADVLWFVEDDMLLPVGVLAAMLEEHEHGARVVTVDYQGRSASGRFIMKDNTGRVMLTPMGCLLVDRSVFAELPVPPWQVHTTQTALPDGTWIDTGKVSVQGQQDVFFSRSCWERGIEIVALDGWEAGHLDVKEYGGRHNFGVDTVLCYGGKGDLQWKPDGSVSWRKHKIRLRERDGDIVADSDDKVIYIMSEKGTVMDILESKARPYIRRKWKPINKTQFDSMARKQAQHRQERIEQQKAELAEMDKPS